MPQQHDEIAADLADGLQSKGVDVIGSASEVGLRIIFVVRWSRFGRICTRIIQRIVKRRVEITRLTQRALGNIEGFGGVGCSPWGVGIGRSEVNVEARHPDRDKMGIGRLAVGETQAAPSRSRKRHILGIQRPVRAVPRLVCNRH